MVGASAGHPLKSEGTWRVILPHMELNCLVAELDKVLVGELNKWVANPLGPGQTSALQIKTRSA